MSGKKGATAAEREVLQRPTYPRLLPTPQADAMSLQRPARLYSKCVWAPPCGVSRMINSPGQKGQDTESLGLARAELQPVLLHPGPDLGRTA